MRALLSVLLPADWRPFDLAAAAESSTTDVDSLLTSSGTVLTAARQRADGGYDALVLALPADKDGDPTPADDLESPDDAWLRHSARVRLEHGAGLEYRHIPLAAGGELAQSAASRVEIVFPVPPLQRPAVLTLVSSVPDQIETLAEDARALADSICFTSAESAPNERPE